MFRTASILATAAFAQQQVEENLRELQGAAPDLGLYEYAYCLVTPNPAISPNTGVEGLFKLKQRMTPNSELEIEGLVTGLDAKMQHALHIHQDAFNGSDCLSSNGHFNPEDVNHGAWNAAVRHTGDMF